ncbi:MAG: hypothetical protein AAFR61_24425 [Bacteroidota bacterium]
MSIPLLIANALCLLAFGVHTYMGDQELRQLEPASSENTDGKRQIWTQVRCGWHWVSVDLLLATIGLSLLNFTSYFTHPDTIQQLLSLYFLAYAVVWAITIALSRSFSQNFLKLGQWGLLLLLAGLIYWG